ncbi:ribosome silencing factor [Lacihabitans lacunae]|jgi:ribosome-associated protein|uniref:Ribosomal silencing factor RsfS n=1 Tax=Lacihabitans lacunae TaxID=1028214 RepID=A0ABV7YXA2_9BACT
MKKTKQISSEQLCDLVINGMQEKKGFDIVRMDLRKIHNSITDFFVICSGSSDTQIDAIASSVDEEVFKGSNQDPWHKEGIQNKEWILLDYVDVVVHVFRKDRREFYDIESLWGDAEIAYYGDTLKPSSVPLN